MPRGSMPGERRGGGQRRTANKQTAIKNAALAAAAANPNLTPGFYGGADYETLGCLVICV